MSRDLRTFGRLIRDRANFRRLWASTIVSLLGDWLSYVAVSLISMQRGDGAVAIGLVLVAHALPVVLLSPVAGALADRFDRRRLLVWSYVGAAFLTGAMWIAAQSASVWVVQGLLLARVAVSSLAMTARTSLVPSVVQPDELHQANSLLGLTWSVLFATGVALGGILSALLGAADAIAIDALTFVIAATIVLRLPSFPPTPNERRPTPGLKEIAFAWRVVRPSPRLTATLLSKAPLAVATSATWVSLNLLAQGRMGAWSAAAGLGLMHMARGVGTGIGPLLPGWLVRREANYGAPMAFLGVAAFLAFDTPWVFFPALVLWGMGTGHNWVAATATVQTQVPDNVLGRVTSLDFLSFSSAQICGALLSGFIIDATGDPTMGAWVGGGIGLVGWAVLLRLQRTETTPVATHFD